MRKICKLLSFSFLVIFILNGCQSNSDNTNVDLFQYKGSYVGDNSAVVNTVIHLDGAEHFSGLQLKTKEEPYGIIINYDWSDSELDEKEITINNASYLFTLIQNLDWITFQFEKEDGMKEYKISRENLNKWYGQDLTEMDSEDRLNELIQESLKDKKSVNKLLN